MNKTLDGLLNIAKTSGMTSHDVVARVRKILKQKRVGHAGTLDPAASGVLPICIGQATRVAEYLSESGKAYRATIHFGVETDTYDAEGNVTSSTSSETLARTDLDEILPRFRGQQMQMPPRYSAIKIQGQAAYKRARAGEEITLSARPIEIFSLEIIDWHNPILTLDIACSKGTYIRSLAYDLGRATGYGAHLSSLVRTRSGPFRLEDSITLEELALASEEGHLARHLQAADKALEDYPAIYLNEEQEQQVQHGNAFTCPPTSEYPSLARVYTSQRQFLAIAEWEAEREKWQPKKVFLDSEPH